jgi:putative tRNA adenosine deaminase-associated protein
VSYFAAALARRSSGWAGEEIHLDDVEDLDGVVDVLRQSAGDDAEVALLLFEQDDEWFAIVRLDDDIDPRVFVSDGRVIETSPLGGILGEAAAIGDADDEDDVDESADDDDDDDDALAGPGDPIGDSELLADLGTPGSQLLELSNEEGLLPADILTAVCERAGCLEVIELIREG